MFSRKIYRGNRKVLNVTIHGQVRDRLAKIAQEQGMSLSSVADEMLYRGLIASGKMRE
jgi:predicted HicB family RNase H-like nuclease